MSTSQVRLERRAEQRFDVHLPVTVSLPQGSSKGQGFTQDLSARGVFLYTDIPLSEGDAVELTLVMPSEITLGENMPVRCRGRVMRIAQMSGARTGVAVHLEGYEYLPESARVTEVSSYRLVSDEQGDLEDSGVSAHTFNFRPVAI